jgi:hypothetical protein
MIFSTLSRRLLQWNKQSNITVTLTNIKKKKPKKSKKERASTGSCNEQSPLESTSKVTTTIIDEASDRTSSDNAENIIATTCTTEEHTRNIDDRNVNESVPDVITLPPPITSVTLRPEEMKFHCQVRIMAKDVKYSMVTKVLNSWENDLKVIPKWETIGGELLLRK